VNLRPSVAAAFTSYTGPFEGYCTWMYLDTKGYVTTGMGNLIDSIQAAQTLPWLTAGNKPASPSQIAAEWRQIKARQSSKNLGGYAFEKWATLHLEHGPIDRLVAVKMADFAAAVNHTYPTFAGAPADAQLAWLDMAWNYGPAFMDKKTASGSWVWPNFRAAVKVSHWARAADNVGDVSRGHTRNQSRARLFLNAASVVTLGIDPDILWLDKTPVRPQPKPDFDLEAEIMAMTPEQRKAFANEIADAILARDAVPNTFTGNKDNPTVALKTALQSIGESLTKLKAKAGIK
jgi:hypothetical protein